LVMIRLWVFPLILFGVAVPGHADGLPASLLDQRIGWAAGYLFESVAASGRLVYLRESCGAIGDSRRYNILRHAGAVFSMAQYAAAQPPDKNASEVLRRAAAYLMDCCAGPVDGQTDMLAIWSPPELTGSSRGCLQAKLGASGLTLAALVRLEFVLPGTTAPKVLRQLANFLLFMQKSDGSFYSKYIPAKAGRDDQWTSLYYPGEAALGLVMLHELDGAVRWLEAAIDALRYLARTREGSRPLPADHWALIATARLFKQNPGSLQMASPAGIPWSEPQEGVSIRGVLLDHATALVESILGEQIEGHERGCLNGGFDLEGRVTPTATRLEGLLAALTFLPAGMLRSRTQHAVGLGVGFLVASQIIDGPARGGIPRYNPLCSSSHTRANEIRIDYVQHALAALLAYRGLLPKDFP
jgi:hypothetical protein